MSHQINITSAEVDYSDGTIVYTLSSDYTGNLGQKITITAVSADKIEYTALDGQSATVSGAKFDHGKGNDTWYHDAMLGHIYP